MALVDGVHFPEGRVQEAAVLAAHMCNLLYQEADKASQEKVQNRDASQLLASCEAKLKEALAEVEKTNNRARSLAARLNTKDAQLGKVTEERAELNRKLESVQPLLRKAQAEAETEKHAKVEAMRVVEETRAALHESNASYGKKLEEAFALGAAREKELKKESAAREKELIKESASREHQLNMNAIRAKNEIIRLERQVAELEQSKASFPDEILLAKQEAYFKGMEMNFLTFDYYGVLDVETFAEAVKDPVKKAGAPREEYAQQWAHLGGAADETNDEGLLLEDGPSITCPDIDPSQPIMEVVPLAYVPPNVESNLPIMGAPSFGEAVMISDQAPVETAPAPEVSSVEPSQPSLVNEPLLVPSCEPPPNTEQAP